MFMHTQSDGAVLLLLLLAEGLHANIPGAIITIQYQHCVVTMIICNGGTTSLTTHSSMWPFLACCVACMEHMAAQQPSCRCETTIGAFDIKVADA